MKLSVSACDLLNRLAKGLFGDLRFPKGLVSSPDLLYQQGIKRSRGVPWIALMQ